MIEVRCLKYLAAALLACLLLPGLQWLYGHTVSYLAVISAYLFGVIFMSVVVVRLPVFKGYYQHDPLSLETRHRSMAEHKAAPVMSSLVTALAYATVLYLAEAPNPGVGVIGSAVTAGVMSHCYEGRF